MLLQFVRTLKHAIFYVFDDLRPTSRRPYYRIDQNALVVILSLHSLTSGPHMSSPSPIHSSPSSALLHPHAGACTCLMGRRARALNLPNAGESSLRVPAPSSLLHERLPVDAALLCSPAGLALLCSRRARAPEGGAGVSAAPASAGPQRRRARADLGGGAPHGRARRGGAEGR